MVRTQLSMDPCIFRYAPDGCPMLGGLFEVVSVAPRARSTFRPEPGQISQLTALQ
jgi:hypothetical protein